MDAYDEVEAALDQARQDLGVKWVDIAERANVSATTLLRYRKGEQRTADTTRALEKVFGWSRGRIQAIRDGTPLPAAEPALEAKSNDAHYADLRMRIDEKLGEAHELMRQLDALVHKRETG